MKQKKYIESFRIINLQLKSQSIKTKEEPCNRLT